MMLAVVLVVMMFSCKDDDNPTEPSKKVTISSITPDSFFTVML